MIRPFLISVAALAAILAATTIGNLPPEALPPTPSSMALTWPVARGAFHVHSQRSDGTGTLDEIAAAAARGGLQFVVMTDHGDGTRSPEPSSYRAGVLIIDGVEISTDAGHYAALDIPQTPYRLAGQPGDVVEDVRRFGGFGFATHPASPKPALQWGDWEARFDGLEWLNADSEWRDEFWSSMGAVLLTYPFRSVETLGAMLDRPTNVLARWDLLTRSRRVAAIAGADAHARLAYRQTADPYEDRVLAKAPSYEVSFRTFVNHVILSGALTGDAKRDALLVTSAIREGHIFTSIDALAGLSAFEAKAVSGGAVAPPGAYLQMAGPVAIEAAIAAPEGTTLSVLRNGEPVYETREPALRVDVGTEPGAYRIEARLPGQTAAAIPWLFTNPMYVGLAEAHARADENTTPASARASIATEAWTAEASAGSTSELRRVTLADGTPAMEWRYSLAAGRRSSQFAAIRFPVSTSVATYDRLQLRAASDQPRRVWAQFRTAGTDGGERWGNSFYLGSALEPIDLRFDEFRAMGAARAQQPPLTHIESLLLVIDTVNTLPGSSGRISITDLWFAR